MMEPPLDDKLLTCKACGQDFVFEAGEQVFFRDRGLAEPRRCKECRRATRERQLQQSQEVP